MTAALYVTALCPLAARVRLLLEANLCRVLPVCVRGFGCMCLCVCAPAQSCVYPYVCVFACALINCVCVCVSVVQMRGWPPALQVAALYANSAAAAACVWVLLNWFAASTLLVACVFAAWAGVLCVCAGYTFTSRGLVSFLPPKTQHALLRQCVSRLPLFASLSLSSLLPVPPACLRLPPPSVSCHVLRGGGVCVMRVYDGGGVCVRARVCVVWCGIMCVRCVWCMHVCVCVCMLARRTLVEWLQDTSFMASMRKFQPLLLGLSEQEVLLPLCVLPC